MNAVKVNNIGGKMATVKIYSTPSCTWCHKTKEFLTEHKVDFTDVNVAENPDAGQEMIKKSGQTGVPVIEIGDEIIVGYNEDKLKDLLKL